MSEDEIIDEINFCNEGEYITREHYQAIQGLLDLYNKEKEKNKELEKDISEMYYKGVVLDILQDELNISRDEAIEILESY
jgi:hypothetical protein